MQVAGFARSVARARRISTMLLRNFVRRWRALMTTEAAWTRCWQWLAKSDTMTLWHLLPQVGGQERERVYNRMATLVVVPVSVKREKALALDPDTLRQWRGGTRMEMVRVVVLGLVLSGIATASDFSIEIGSPVAAMSPESAVRVKKVGGGFSVRTTNCAKPGAVQFFGYRPVDERHEIEITVRAGIGRGDLRGRATRSNHRALGRRSDRRVFRHPGWRIGAGECSRRI